MFPSLVPEFKEVMSADESRVTVDLAAACAGAIAPTESPAATSAMAADAAKARIAIFFLI